MIEQKSLETFFGIGNHTSSRLLARFNIHPTCRVGELANKQVLDLTAVLSDMKIENDLRREVLNDIKRLKETGTYRGRRHALGLPVRGQRTRTQVGVSFVSISCLSLRPDLATSLALVHVVLVASGDFVAGRILAKSENLKLMNLAIDQNPCQAQPDGAPAMILISFWNSSNLVMGQSLVYCVGGMGTAFLT